MNDDKTIITGAIMGDHFADGLFDWDNSIYYYYTYIINFNTTGVETAAMPVEEGLYRVYNLQGVKVLETKDASQLKTLSKGVYVINGKKIAL